MFSPPQHHLVDQNPPCWEPYTRGGQAVLEFACLNPNPVINLESPMDIHVGGGLNPIHANFLMFSPPLVIFWPTWSIHI